jgi:hypothetical protein
MVPLGVQCLAPVTVRLYKSKDEFDRFLVLYDSAGATRSNGL